MNANKLKAKVIERGMNMEKLADEVGMDRSTMYRKLANFEKFTIGDARKIKVALNLTGNEATEIFL